jgi:sulfur carrier protein ThiS
MSQNDSIVVTIRSHITPSADIKDFKLGKPFQLRLNCNNTMEKLIEKLFFKNKEHIGFVSINGQIIRDNSVLTEGDEIRIFALISGG